MTKPIVGIIGNHHKLEDRFDIQMTGLNNFQAVSQITGAMPLMFASDSEATDVAALVDTVDGILLTGARANVHPQHFGVSASESYEPYDIGRDSIALPLVRKCVELGLPLLGVCRGFQEMNVAFGGTLHPEIRDVPGRMNHRMPRLASGEIHPDLDVVFGETHDVNLTTGGIFETLYGGSTIRVNSLHGQAILDAGERIVIEGLAEDGTVEAIRIAEASGFAMGVQWHTEYQCQRKPVNRVMFEAFGRAISEYCAQK